MKAFSAQEMQPERGCLAVQLLVAHEPGAFVKQAGGHSERDDRKVRREMVGEIVSLVECVHQVPARSNIVRR